MAADEARRAGGGSDDARLGRADVDHGRVARRGERGGDGSRELCDRRRDDDELGAGDGLLEARRRLDGAARDGRGERVGIGVEPKDDVPA